jgi:hypothetical protein
MKLEDYIKKVTELIKKLLSEGRAGDIKAEIKKLANEIGVSPAELNKIARAEIYSQKDIFVADYSFIELLTNEYEGIKDAFDNSVYEAVRRGLARNDSMAKILERLRSLGSTAEQHIGTVENTISLGLNRAGALKNATDAGIKQYKYIGPSLNIRPFCAIHLGRTYTLDEIKAMSNGQGLPVLYYCGGYNCRHTWMPIF